MKTIRMLNAPFWRGILTITLLAIALFHVASNGRAQGLPGGGSGTNQPTYTPLDSWYFEDTNSWPSAYGFNSISFTNLSASPLGDDLAVVVDSTNQAWLQYNVYEADGTTNLTVDTGSITFWFAPDWSSTNDANGGYGPGVSGRLLEVGSYTTNSSYGWWSLYVDGAGANIYFSAQTNDGLGNTYTISSPIDWWTNRWHFVAISYSSTNVSLYLDGQLATNDSGGLTVWPGVQVLTNGFYVGSDSTGILQAHGMFDDLRTYNVVVDGTTINDYFNQESFPYYLNPLNPANDLRIASAVTSVQSYAPYVDIFSGPGNLQWVTNVSACVSSTNFWITNVVASAAANGTMNLQFSIAGGQDGSFYDVFAISQLGTTNSWSWMGQGQHCNTYILTNLPSSTGYLILGGPQDSDGDGVTDAYERLVSHTNPNLYSSDGSGMSDGWEIFYFGHTGIDPNADPDGDGLTNYQEYMGGTNPKVPDNYGTPLTEPKPNSNLP
jgi:hypothetical protein